MVRSLHRRGRQRGQRRPDMLLRGRIDGDAFLGEDGRHPLRRPGALGRIVDPRQRLQRDGMLRPGRQAAAEIVPVAAHGDRRGADRAAEIEGEDLVVAVAAELHRHQRQQHRFAGAGRADDQRVADVADMQAEPERRRAFGLAEQQRRRLEMLIPCRPGPDRRERDHVRQIQRRDRRLADVGVGMAGDGAEPGLERIHPFRHAGEVAALDHLLHEAELLGGETGVLVPDGDGRGDIGLADIVGAQLLQRHVRVGRLVGGVGIDQGRGLVGHHLLDDGGDGLALGEPLPPDLGEQLHRFGLVEQDRAGGPAIREGEPVQLVEDAGMGRGRESDHGERAKMMGAEARLEAAGERLVGEQRIEVHRRLGHADALRTGRDGRVQVGQRVAVIEPGHLGHEALDQLQDAVGPIDEAAQQLPRIDAGLRAALVEPALDA